MSEDSGGFPDWIDSDLFQNQEDPLGVEDIFEKPFLFSANLSIPNYNEPVMPPTPSPQDVSIVLEDKETENNWPKGKYRDFKVTLRNSNPGVNFPIWLGDDASWKNGNARANAKLPTPANCFSMLFQLKNGCEILHPCEKCMLKGVKSMLEITADYRELDFKSRPAAIILVRYTCSPKHHKKKDINTLSLECTINDEQGCPIATSSYTLPDSCKLVASRSLKRKTANKSSRPSKKQGFRLPLTLWIICFTVVTDHFPPLSESRFLYYFSKRVARGSRRFHCVKGWKCSVAAITGRLDSVSKF